MTCLNVCSNIVVNHFALKQHLDTIKLNISDVLGEQFFFMFKSCFRLPAKAEPK